MMRSHASSRKFYLKAIKLDPYNDQILSSFAELEEIEVRKRATIRGDNPTNWFKEGDFAFEELALDEIEKTVPYSTLQEEEDQKRQDRILKKQKANEQEQRVMLDRSNGIRGSFELTDAAAASSRPSSAKSSGRSNKSTKKAVKKPIR